MSSYIIEGGKRLQGATYVSGSKNASLPIMAASILNKGITKLYNVPKIHDTEMMYKILKNLGCTVKKSKNKVIIDKILSVEMQSSPDNIILRSKSSIAHRNKSRNSNTLSFFFFF